MAKRRYKRTNKKTTSALLIILVIIVVALALLYYFKPEVFNSLFKGDGGNGKDTTILTGQQQEIASADLSIHFLELGNKYTGDCTLIKVGDTEVLIDAGSRKDSAEHLKTYIDAYCTDGVLEYVIATHAHQDHIAAFVGSESGDTRTGLLYQYEIGTLIQFSRSDATSDIYNDYCEAVEYIKGEGTAVYTALECWKQTNGAKKQYFLNGENTVSMNILYNYFYENKTQGGGGENEYSVCMLLSQQLESGDKHYLFTGDLEEKGEEYLVEYNPDLPEVELFKGGHHGSYTANTEALLSVIKPKYVAICCCCGTPEYTKEETSTHNFPAQEVIDRISKYTDKIYCTTLINDYDNNDYTPLNGNIVFYYGKSEEEQAASLKLWCSNNSTILKDTEWFKNNRTWNG